MPSDDDKALESGLYLLATPIGNAADITLRALSVLRQVDCIAAEDTRSARRLMALHGINRNDRPILSYHDHSSPAQRQRILRHLDERRTVALLSDAGTPLISDPGYTLVRMAIERGHRIIPLPPPARGAGAIQ